MYCKSMLNLRTGKRKNVLIVAKCIVNRLEVRWLYNSRRVLIVAKCIVNLKKKKRKKKRKSINSSKVYCKWKYRCVYELWRFSINSSKVYCKFRIKIREEK